MENAYDLGQRVERLLYMSVVVIAFSFIILSLSKSLAISQEVNKTLSYKNVIAALKRNEGSLKLIHEINVDYNKHLQSENKRKEAFDKEGKSLKKAEDLKDENIIRKKLGLTQLFPEERKFKPHSYIGYDFKLAELNQIRSAFGLPKLSKLDEATESEKDIVNEIVKNESTNTEIATSLLGVLQNYNYGLEKLKAYLYSEINKSQSAKIKILDVDAPISFPVSIGDMKLSIPMQNIMNWSIIVMPIFLVIWIGAIFITRYFEVTKILESKLVTNFYPHILNLFSINSKNHSSDEIKLKIASALNGNNKAIRYFRIESMAFSIFRILLVIVVVLAMTVPVYYGFYIYMESDDTKKIHMYILCIFVPAFINLIQLISCVVTESRTFNKSFILDGANSDIL